MKSLAVLLGVLTLSCVILTGCDVGYALAHGNLETRAYDLAGFTAVDVSSAFQYDVTRADDFSISIDAGDFTNIKVQKENQTLRVYREGVGDVVFYRPMVKITLPVLTGLSISGASAGAVSGFDDGELALEVNGASQLELSDMTVAGLTGEVSGASRVTGAITITGKTNLEISGASRVELSGAARELSLKVSGASRTELGNLAAESGDVHYSGASSGTVNLTGQLDANLEGASSLYLRGTATIGRLDTTGSSSFHRK